MGKRLEAAGYIYSVVRSRKGVTIDQALTSEASLSRTLMWLLILSYYSFNSLDTSINWLANSFNHRDYVIMIYSLVSLLT